MARGVWVVTNPERPGRVHIGIRSGAGLSEIQCVAIYRQMSLVVARKLGERICMVADSKVTDPRESRTNHLHQLLKIVAVSSDCAVAYAGSVDGAHMALQELLTSSIARDHEVVCQLLLKSQKDCRQSVDFIVGSLQPTARLARISGGKICPDLPAAWIGDADAFTSYQTSFHTSPHPAAEW